MFSTRCGILLALIVVGCGRDGSTYPIELAVTNDSSSDITVKMERYGNNKIFSVPKGDSKLFLYAVKESVGSYTRADLNIIMVVRDAKGNQIGYFSREFDTGDGSTEYDDLNDFKTSELTCTDDECILNGESITAKEEDET